MPKKVTANQPLAILVDRKSRMPIVEQVASGLRNAVHARMLGAGDRLPSSRTLARQLGVARGTIATAYEQLVSEGYVESRIGSGTRIARRLSQERVHTAIQSAATQVRRKEGSRLRGELEQVKDLLAVRFHAPFAVISPSADLAPGSSWNTISARVGRASRTTAGRYHDAQGLSALREMLAAYLHRSRGVVCAPEQVVITTGAQQALSLTVKVLLDAGDRVAVENPGYLPLHHLLSCARMRITPLPVDGEGAVIEPEKLIKKDVKALFLTPSHQYPLGMVLSMRRRVAALEWASRSGGWIVEDDYDSEFRYGGRPFPALQGMGLGDRIVYAGSLSKALSPSIRIGYAVVPGDIAAAFVGAKRLEDFHSPIQEQASLAEFIGVGLLEAHVRRVRQVLQERHAALKNALSAETAQWLDVVPSDQGLFVTTMLRGGDDIDVTLRAVKERMELRPLSPHYIGPVKHAGLILGFAAFPPAEIRKSVSRLARILRLG